MKTRNLTLMTDLYELTMMQGYFKNMDRNETVIFDAFYRNFVLNDQRKGIDDLGSICAEQRRAQDCLPSLVQNQFAEAVTHTVFCNVPAA